MTGEAHRTASSVHLEGPSPQGFPGSSRRTARLSKWRRPAAPFVLGAALVAGAAPLVAAVPAAQAAECSDVEVIFARGSGELPGLGITGTPLVQQIGSRLPDRSVTSYAVQYAAAYDQSSAGAGANDMTGHLTEQAKACPQTQFVLGGYSQGASVTDISLGISTTLGRGTAIDAQLAPRVAAVVVFGNPLGLSGRTIENSSELYGDRAKSYCNIGDPVCGLGGNSLAHLTYASDGSVTDAADFAVAQLAAGQGDTQDPGGSQTPEDTADTTDDTPDEDGQSWWWTDLFGGFGR